MILQGDHVLYMWDGLRNCHFLRDRLWNVSQLVKQNKQDNVSPSRRRNLKSGLLNHEVILVHTRWFRRKTVCAFPQLISLFSLKEATWHKVYMLCDVYQHDRRYNWMVQRQQRGSKVVTLTNLLWWWICWYYILIKVRHIIASHHVTVYYVHAEMLCYVYSYTWGVYECLVHGPVGISTGSSSGGQDFGGATTGHNSAAHAPYSHSGQGIVRTKIVFLESMFNTLSWVLASCEPIGCRGVASLSHAH